MWDVIIAIALIGNMGRSPEVQSGTVAAIAKVSRVEVCVSDPSAGTATISLDVEFTNRSDKDVVGTWDFVPGEIFAAPSEEEGRANRWLWSFGFHRTGIPDLKVARLRAGKTKRVSQNLVIPVSRPGMREPGLLPMGGSYYFVLRFQDEFPKRSQRPSRVAFFAAVPSTSRPCQ